MALFRSDRSRRQAVVHLLAALAVLGVVVVFRRERILAYFEDDTAS